MRTYCFPSIFKCIVCNVAMRKVITLRNIITYIITIYLCYYILRRDQRYKHKQHLQHLLRHFPGVLAVKKKADQTKRLRTTNITEYVPDASSMGSLPKKTHTVYVCLQDSEARDLKTNEIVVITNIHVHVSSHCNLMIMNFMQINFVNIGIANSHNFTTPKNYI